MQLERLYTAYVLNGLEIQFKFEGDYTGCVFPLILRCVCVLYTDCVEYRVSECVVTGFFVFIILFSGGEFIMKSASVCGAEFELRTF